MKKAGVFILMTFVLSIMWESCGSTQHEVCPAYGGQAEHEVKPAM
jgi:hypothetical protein